MHRKGEQTCVDSTVCKNAQMLSKRCTAVFPETPSVTSDGWCHVSAKLAQLPVQRAALPCLGTVCSSLQVKAAGQRQVSE